jgi:hypothetical protein
MKAAKNLQELRTEHMIYKAAPGLVVELAKNPAEFDVDGARQCMAEIARDIRA